MMGMNILRSGQDFDDLPDSYVIFITRGDVLGAGLPIYHVRRNIEETGEGFGNGTYIVYVDAGRQDDTELGRLMHDLICKDPKNVYSPVLAQRIRELKETEGGIKSMCEVMDRIYSE